MSSNTLTTTHRTTTPGPKHHPLATWFAIRKAFVMGEASLSVLAAKFNVSLATMRDRSKREGWYVARTDYFNQANAALLNPAPPAVQPPPQPPENTQPAEISRIENQIERLNNLLDIETDARCLDKLTASLTRLYERRRILLGIPLPGSQRPNRKVNRVRPSDLGAIELS